MATEGCREYGRLDEAHGELYAIGVPLARGDPSRQRTGITFAISCELMK
jgi:hypothetical protein